MSWLSSLRVNNIPVNKYTMWIAATKTGVLLWLAWPVGPGAPLLFVAWIPLLWVDQKLTGKGAEVKFFFMVWWACLIWNACTTWWIYYSTAAGSVVAIIANAFLMTIPWMLYRLTKRMAGQPWGYLSWVLYWCSFEQIHLSWEISWPWLTMGNGFAMFPEWIQWYEYTGVFGGTLWVLLINLGLFRLLFTGVTPTKRLVIGLVAGLVMPIAISYLIYFNYQEQGPEVEFVVVQPNVDPFTEKFIDSENFIGFEQQVDRFIQLSEQAVNENTSFLLWPESAIDGLLDEDFLLAPEILPNSRAVQADNLKSVIRIREYKQTRPDLSLLTGLTSYKLYQDISEVTPTARSNGGVYYDAYNTAYFLADNGTVRTYHKSKLVPGPETMPYPKVFGFLSDLLVDFGGTSGQLAKQKERTVFFNSKGLGLAPSIC